MKYELMEKQWKACKKYIQNGKTVSSEILFFIVSYSLYNQALCDIDTFGWLADKTISELETSLNISEKENITKEKYEIYNPGDIRKLRKNLEGKRLFSGFYTNKYREEKWFKLVITCNAKNECYSMLVDIDDEGKLLKIEDVTGYVNSTEKEKRYCFPDYDFIERWLLSYNGRNLDLNQNLWKVLNSREGHRPAIRDDRWIVLYEKSDGEYLVCYLSEGGEKAHSNYFDDNTIKITKKSEIGNWLFNDTTEFYAINGFKYYFVSAFRTEKDCIEFYKELQHVTIHDNIDEEYVQKQIKKSAASIRSKLSIDYFKDKSDDISITEILIDEKECYSRLIALLSEHPNYNDGVVHVTEFDNFLHILKNGCLKSRNQLMREQYQFKDVAIMEIVADTADEIRESCRFYYRFNTPTYRKARYEKPIGLVFSSELFKSEGARFTDGNARMFASTFGSLQDACEFDWDTIYTHKYELSLNEDIRRMENAEFLLKGNVSLDYLTKIYFPNSITANIVLERYGGSSGVIPKDCQLIIDNEVTYVKKY